MHRLRHKSTMRLPHACYVIRARDGRSDRRRHFRSTCAPALPSQFRNALNQLESHTSPSRSAESSRMRHLRNNGPFHHITDASCQKYYYIWIESFAIGSFFILKLVGSGPLLRMAEYSSLFGILSFIFEHIQLGTMFYRLSA